MLCSANIIILPADANLLIAVVASVSLLLEGETQQTVHKGFGTFPTSSLDCSCAITWSRLGYATLLGKKCVL